LAPIFVIITMPVLQAMQTVTPISIERSVIMRYGLIVLALLMTGPVIDSAAAEDLQLSNRTTINLDVAKAIAAAASAYAVEKDWVVNIAIVDDGTNLVYFERGNGVQIGSIDVAIRKAKTAAAFKRPTKVFDDLASGGRTAIVTLPEGLLLEGGEPIVWQGQVIGAVGVSGVTSPQDAEIARAGIETVLDHLAAE
jgi:uncharacterized protein GlcG (DUF336 family)